MITPCELRERLNVSSEVRIEASRYYHLVPKDIHRNLAYRKDMVSYGKESKRNAPELFQMCREDILFWINTFVWTYDPRRIAADENPIVPFNTYAFQDLALLQIESCCGREPLLIDKSRDMGATWMILLVFYHEAKYKVGRSFLCVSRNENYVDKTGNPDSLFWKLDFIMKYEPGFLNVPYVRNKNHLEFPGNESAIVGESNTEDIGRGGRDTAVMVDEFSAFGIQNSYQVMGSIPFTTNSPIYNSTTKGKSGAYYELKQNPDIRKLSMHWTLHPEHRSGLYTSEKDKVKILDTEYEYPPDYKFVLDGKVRSVYYDEKCRLIRIPLLIARELDMDDSAAYGRWYSEEIVARNETKYARRPFLEGDFKYNAESMEPEGFQARAGGMLKLWCRLDHEGKPIVSEDMVCGIDVSAGTGASNSALVFYGKHTGEKYAELVASNLPPHRLGEVAAALGRWFGNAKLIWEAQGDGRTFGRVLLDCQYENIFYHRSGEDSIDWKTTMKPGYFHGNGTKRILHGDYLAALDNESIMNRSHFALSECREFIYNEQGDPEHAKEKGCIDPSGARKSHGDIVTADALAWRLIQDYRSSLSGKEKNEELQEWYVPVGCIEWAIRQEDRKNDSEGDYWFE